MNTKLVDSLTDGLYIAEIACFHPINSRLYPGPGPLISKVLKPGSECLRFANLYHL